MKKISIILLFTSLFLMGCQNKKENITKITTQTTSSTDNKKAEEKTMNFEEIKKGDFTSLVGDWYQFAYGYNPKNSQGYLEFLGGNTEFKITPTSVEIPEMKLTKNEIQTNAGNQKVTYKEMARSLSVGLVEDAPINWNITFYPIGTTSEYKINPEDTTNKSEIIKIWSSNMGSTTILARGKKKKEPKVIPLNINDLIDGYNDSLVGLWNNGKGQLMEVTSETVVNPDTDQKGVVVKEKNRGEYPRIIVFNYGFDNGTGSAGIGTFNPKILNSPFSAVILAPKGVELQMEGRKTDASRDRMALGSTLDSVYYRE